MGFPAIILYAGLFLFLNFDIPNLNYIVNINK